MKLWKIGLLLLLCASSLRAEDASLTVDLAKPGIKVSPALYGIFFEEINRAGDGGIYAEMIQNRSFEDSDNLTIWTIERGEGLEAQATLDKSKPLNDRNPRALRIEVTKPGTGGIRIVNDGFKGMFVNSNAKYVATLWARADDAFKGPLTVGIESSKGQRQFTGKVEGIGAEWKKFEIPLTVEDTDASAKFVIETNSPGVVWIDMVSLFPAETWKSHGFRPDLAQMLDDLKPAFMRFPGGCWVEGETLATAYRWKDTIGDVAQRKSNYNLWKYMSTNGLGYHEYLQLCEDLGAEALFVVNCAMSHAEQRGRNAPPVKNVDEYLQDALDAIEYATGPADSKWGGERAKNGHPAPFNLKYIQIGNENGGPIYNERYGIFYDAIKKKYPQINIIANLWQGRPNSRPIEILDEHYYNSPAFFLDNANRYDTYDRSGPKIYVGEYACTRDCGQGNLRAAVGEAAFMAGMERNSDIVIMSSYAPLFANVNYKAWNPDAINFDASRCYGTPSYWVQQMFSRNRADVILPMTLQVSEEQPKTRSGAVGLGTWVTQAEFENLKVEKDGKVLYQSDFTAMPELRNARGEWKVADGALQQTSNRENCIAMLGDAEWTDYTFSLKARKISGNEGFLILVHAKDARNFTWLNLGGWRNTQHGMEMDVDGGRSQFGRQTRGQIETGKWYDIRVEVAGQQIKAYLDDQLVQDVKYPNPRPLHGVAGRAGDDVIVKLVNGSNQTKSVAIKLDGATQVDSKGQAIVLTGNPLDENTLDEPTKVAPKTSEITTAAGSFTHDFLANSVTILRLKAK